MFGAWNALGLAGKIVAGVIGLIVVGAILYGVVRFMGAPQRAAEAETANRAERAYSDSARAAIDVIVAAETRDEKTQERIEDAVVEISKLPEAERYAASIALLCGMREYVSDPRCAGVQPARTERVEEGRGRSTTPR